MAVIRWADSGPEKPLGPPRNAEDGGFEICSFSRGVSVKMKRATDAATSSRYTNRVRVDSQVRTAMLPSTIESRVGGTAGHHKTHQTTFRGPSDDTAHPNRQLDFSGATAVRPDKESPNRP